MATLSPGLDECGTYAAYQRHYKRGEEMDAACRHAATVYQGRWRVRNKRTSAARVPYEVLGVLLQAVPTGVEEWVERQLGDAVVTRAIEAAQGLNGHLPREER